MLKLNFTILVICLAAVLFCTNSVFSQQSVSPEKKDLIQEIQDLTGVKKFSVQTKFSSTNIGDALAPLLEKEKELTDDQKLELKIFFSETKEWLEKQIRDFSADKAISDQVAEEVSFQLFDKNFTESELREMVVFYRTPTGQKAAKFMINYTSQLGKLFGDSYNKKLKEFAESKLNEANELIKQKIKELKNKTPEA